MSNFWDDHRINKQQPSADSLKKARGYRESREVHNHTTIEEVRDHLASTAEMRRQRREAMGQIPVAGREDLRSQREPRKRTVSIDTRAPTDATAVTPRRKRG